MCILKLSKTNKNHMLKAKYFYIIDMLLVSPENRSESNPYFHLGG